MSKVLVTESYLTDIGNAIRNKNGSTNQYKPSEMAAAISNIKGEDIIVTRGDKYTLNVVKPKNGTISSYFVAKSVNNSDGTFSAGLTDHSTYVPDTGYDPGIISRSVDKDTGVYTITGTAASPTSIVDSHGLARVYYKVDTFDYDLYKDSLYTDKLSDIENASGKLLILDINSNRDYIDFETRHVTCIYAPSISKYGAINFFPYSSSYNNILKYVSFPSWTGIVRVNESSSYEHAGFEYFDIGRSTQLQCGFDPTFNITNLIIRNPDSIVDASWHKPKKVVNAYVPSSLLSTYQANSVWSGFVTNFIALEGSKYEDPYAFLDEIPT